MIPEIELQMIIDASKAYIAQRGYAKENFVGNPELANAFSLEDHCIFSDKDYTVGQLLIELQNKTEVGLKFADKLYQLSQENPILDEISNAEPTEDVMIEITSGKITPVNIFLQNFIKDPDTRNWVQSIDYLRTIYQATHQKGD